MNEDKSFPILETGGKAVIFSVIGKGFDSEDLGAFMS